MSQMRKGPQRLKPLLFAEFTARLKSCPPVSTLVKSYPSVLGENWKK